MTKSRLPKAVIRGLAFEQIDYLGRVPPRGPASNKERFITAATMHLAGHTYQSIGDHFGVTRARAEQLAQRGRELGIAKREMPRKIAGPRRIALPSDPVIACGTAFEYAPVRRHAKRGESPCDLCAPVARVWSYAKHLRREARRQGLIFTVQIDEVGDVILLSDDPAAVERWVAARRLQAHRIRVERIAPPAPPAPPGHPMCDDRIRRGGGFALASVRRHRRAGEELCAACQLAESTWTSAMQLQRVGRRDGYDTVATVDDDGTIVVSTPDPESVTAWLDGRPERRYEVRVVRRT